MAKDDPQAPDDTFDTPEPDAPVSVEFIGACSPIEIELAEVTCESVCRFLEKR